MNNEDLIETKEIDNYRISVWRDDSPICPLKDWDMTGMFLWSDNSRGRLSSYSSFDNKVLYDGNSYTLEEALECLIDHYVPYGKLLSYLKGGGLSSVKLQYDRSLRCWHVMYYDDRYNKRYEETFTVDELRSGCASDLTGYIDYDDLVTIMRDCAKDVAICEWRPEATARATTFVALPTATRSATPRCAVRRRRVGRSAPSPTWSPRVNVSASGCGVTLSATRLRARCRTPRSTTTDATASIAATGRRRTPAGVSTVTATS